MLTGLERLDRQRIWTDRELWNLSNPGVDTERLRQADVELNR